MYEYWFVGGQDVPGQSLPGKVMGEGVRPLSNKLPTLPLVGPIGSHAWDKAIYLVMEFLYDPGPLKMSMGIGYTCMDPVPEDADVLTMPRTVLTSLFYCTPATPCILTSIVLHVGCFTGLLKELELPGGSEVQFHIEVVCHQRPEDDSEGGDIVVSKKVIVHDHQQTVLVTQGWIQCLDGCLVTCRPDTIFAGLELQFQPWG
jgi:hypothetical protein